MVCFRAEFVCAPKTSGNFQKFRRDQGGSCGVGIAPGEMSEKHSGRIIMTHNFALKSVWSEETHVISIKHICGRLL